MESTQSGHGFSGCADDRIVPNFVLSLQQHAGQGEVPSLTPNQREALEILEETCVREALQMNLEAPPLVFVLLTTAGRFPVRSELSYPACSKGLHRRPGTEASPSSYLAECF